MIKNFLQVVYTKNMNEDKLKETIATNIRMQRAKKHITQEQLAELIGLSTTSLCSLENNSALPKITTLMKLAEVFDIKVDDLLH